MCTLNTLTWPDLSRTEKPAKAGTCARDRCALQHPALNVHVKHSHSDLTWPDLTVLFNSLIQILEQEGLGKYVDAKCLQQEIAEATDMTPEEMDYAAHQLLRRSQVPATAPSGGPYLEHLGGFSPHEFKDYNQYSVEDEPLQHRPVIRRHMDSRRHRRHDDYDYDEDEDGKRVHVTTL